MGGCMPCQDVYTMEHNRIKFFYCLDKRRQMFFRLFCCCGCNEEEKNLSIATNLLLIFLETHHTQASLVSNNCSTSSNSLSSSSFFRCGYMYRKIYPLRHASYAFNNNNSSRFPKGKKISINTKKAALARGI